MFSNRSAEFLLSLVRYSFAIVEELLHCKFFSLFFSILKFRKGKALPFLFYYFAFHAWTSSLLQVFSESASQDYDVQRNTYYSITLKQCQRNEKVLCKCKLLLLICVLKANIIYIEECIAGLQNSAHLQTKAAKQTTSLFMFAAFHKLETSALPRQMPLSDAPR